MTASGYVAIRNRYFFADAGACEVCDLLWIKHLF